MALRYPDVMQHNNPQYSIVDADYVRGGARLVTDLTSLYALASNVDQLKERVTRVYVLSTSSYYSLIDLTNVDNSTGWVIDSSSLYSGATADIDMSSHKLTNLSIPTANGDSIRATTKITEVRLESATDHTSSTLNPHSVTKAQITLGNVDNTSDVNKPVSTAQATAIGLKQDLLGFIPEDSANKGVNNGYVGLDSNAKISTSNLPDAILGALKWKGTFSIVSNLISSDDLTLDGNPLPTSTTDTNGWYFIVQDLGDVGGIHFEIGDWLISNGSAGWNIVDNTDAVKSVNGQYGIVSLDYSDVGAQVAGTYSTDIHTNITALDLVSGTNTGDHAVNSNYSGLVSFPGFGITHVLTAYGDHDHSGVYQPIASVLTDTTASYTTTEQTKLAAITGINTGDQTLPTLSSLGAASALNNEGFGVAYFQNGGDDLSADAVSAAIRAGSAYKDFDGNIISVTYVKIVDASVYSTDIHSNITALDLVSGTNTGDQDMSILAPKVDPDITSLSVTQPQWLPGTINAMLNTFSVTGNGTQFIKDFKIGDTISFGTYTKTITSITSNTSMGVTKLSAVTSGVYTYSNTSYGTRFVVYGNGKVGINTVLPQTELDIDGSITPTGYIYQHYLHMGDSVGDRRSWNNTGILQFERCTSNSAVKGAGMWVADIVVSGNGDAGIGMIPTFKFDVNGTLAISVSTSSSVETVACQLWDGGYGGSHLLGSIRSYNQGGYSQQMRFYTTDDGSTENLAMVLNSNSNVGIGVTFPNTNAILDVVSTTKAFMPPRMTNTQKAAIASPTAGMVVFDLTLMKLCVYSTAWETLTSI